MPLITLFIYLIVIALLVIGTRRFVPETAQPIKNIIVWALAAVAVVLILNALGVFDALRGMSTPRVG